MVRYLLVVAAAASVFPAAAQVQDKRVSDRGGVVRTTEVIKSGKGLETVTCREFIALDESFKPEAVMYVANYDRKGRPKGEQVDVAGVEKVTPAVVNTCRTRPGASLLEHVRLAMRGHRK